MSRIYPNKNWQIESSSTSLYNGMFQRCSACNQLNKIGRSPEGGEYVASRRATPTAGQTWGNPIEANCGCWCCGSPAWRKGGKLGDLARSH